MTTAFCFSKKWPRSGTLSEDPRCARTMLGDRAPGLESQGCHSQAVTSGNFLNLPEPQFLFFKVGLIKRFL